MLLRMIDFRELRQAFGYAFAGVCYAFRTQQNFRIGLAGGVLVVAAGILFKLTLFEWVAVTFSAFLVLITEMINTVFEEMVNLLKCEYDRRCEIAKDVSAGMVVLALSAAIITGLLIFVPKVLSLFC